MKRVIDFRAWDRDKQIMEYCGTERAGEYHIHVGNPIMQFTGLRDPKGNDIYEGDIAITWFPGGQHITGEVVFDKVDMGRILVATPCFCVKHIDGEGYSPLDNESWEVIGNIYEHPELLREHMEGFLSTKYRSELQNMLGKLDWAIRQSHDDKLREGYEAHFLPEHKVEGDNG